MRAIGKTSLLLLLWVLSFASSAQEIRFPGGVTSQDRRWDYIAALLQLVLDKTNAQGEKAQVVRLPAMAEARRIAELHAGRLDVAFGIASTKLETSGVRLIPIPLQKGMTGWRLLLVTPQSAPRFAQVRDLASLQPLRAGFSTSFADYPIMVSNGLTMSPGTEYIGLFDMLRLDRSDYISRGVGEVYPEVTSMDGGKPGSLLVHPTLALHYPADMVFIVSPQRPELAARLDKGLRQSIQDGSRERLFQQHFGAVLEKAALHKRTVIELHNPYLPEGMDPNDKTLWWRP